MHKLEDGAVVQNVAGLHVRIGRFGRRPSISTQVDALRRMLLEPDVMGISGKWFKNVARVCYFSRALASPNTLLYTGNNSTNHRGT